MSFKKDIILETALKLFLINGIDSTSVDNICSELSISKKTLYEKFSSKEEIIKMSFNALRQKLSLSLKTIEENQISSIEKFYLFFSLASKLFGTISEKFLKDLKTKYPKLWIELDDFRSKKLSFFFEKTYMQGVNEGYFIAYPTEIITRIWIGALRNVINPEFILKSNYSIEAVFDISIDFLFRSLLSKKGVSQFEKIKKRRTKIFSNIKTPLEELL